MRVATLLFLATAFFWLDALSRAFQASRLAAPGRGAAQTTRNDSHEAIRLRLIARISLPAGINSMVISPNGRELYGSSYPTNLVCAVDLQRRKVVSSVRLASSPQGLTITPDGTKLYVGHPGAK